MQNQTPGADFPDYFRRAIPLVSASASFISTNVMLSLDERFAVNLVQFATRAVPRHLAQAAHLAHIL